MSALHWDELTVQGPFAETLTLTHALVIGKRGQSPPC
jgi:hypothetical protein